MFSPVAVFKRQKMPVKIQPVVKRLKQVIVFVQCHYCYRRSII